LTHSLRHQRTLANPISVDGFGYWSGKDVRIEFRPAEPDTGIHFVRRDLDTAGRIPAVVVNRVEIPRRTTLTTAEGTVEMVEHVMAALAGLQIDNCEVWVDQPEMPGCDGSSRPFVEALLDAGVVNQPAYRSTLTVSETVRVGDDQCWVEAQPSSRVGLSIRYRLDYGNESPIGRQTIQMALSPEEFCRELAPARTFILQQEAEWLRQQGLGQRVTCNDLLVFDDAGPIDNPLRFEDECVRHKTLDLVGDLALAGCDIHGHLVAFRSGHRLNAELVRALLAEEQVVEDFRRIA
jgi:UDP-3-O-acyl N-acetylglucosamine deacetylase